MSYFITIIGAISMIFGLLLWLSPQIMVIIGDVLNREVKTAQYIERKRNFIGVILIILGTITIWNLRMKIFGNMDMVTGTSLKDITPLVTILLTISIFVILYGLLIIVRPQWINSLGRVTDVVIGILDFQILKYRVLWGGIFLTTGIAIFYFYNAI